MKYLCDSYTDVGGRNNNEDSYTVVGGPNGILLVVADGLGGHDRGEVASSIAVNTLRDEFSKDGVFDPVGAIKLANKYIMERQEQTGLQMKTTICVAYLKDGMAQFCHVGDSRIYAFNKETIVYQSMDHSASQMAVNVGEITLSQIRSHPDRNMLIRALGVTDDVRVDAVSVSESSFDSLLLCTDGFWEYVLEEEMIAYKLSSDTTQLWLEKMRDELAKRVSGENDNNTAIVILKDGES